MDGEWAWRVRGKGSHVCEVGDVVAVARGDLDGLGLVSSKELLHRERRRGGEEGIVVHDEQMQRLCVPRRSAPPRGRRRHQRPRPRFMKRARRSRRHSRACPDSHQSQSQLSPALVLVGASSASHRTSPHTLPDARARQRTHARHMTPPSPGRDGPLSQALATPPRPGWASSRPHSFSDRAVTRRHGGD